MPSESHYWIIVVEAELFGVQAWIKGVLGSSGQTGAVLVPFELRVRRSTAPETSMGLTQRRAACSSHKPI